MSHDIHPAFLKNFITEELYLVGEKGSVLHKAAADVVAKSELTEGKVPAESPKVRQNTLVILKQRLQDIEPSQKELLTKITSAVKLDLTSATVLSEAEYKADPLQVSNFKNVLSFGVELSPPTSKYAVTRRAEQQFLASDSLAALEQAIALKGKLWKAMQEMFLNV